MPSKLSPPSLFAEEDFQQPVRVEPIGPASFVLRGHALPWIERILPALRAVLAEAPLRYLVTPGGLALSAKSSSCGRLGWVSDTQGYRYSHLDPQTGRPWPALPEDLQALAETAARSTGFNDFIPDTCLINRYTPGARMSLHQDKNEKSRTAPVVSVSLGLPAVFLFGGAERHERPQKISLFHGDVVVWGGVDRLRFHGVQPIKDGLHPLLGAQRINLTLRLAG